MTYFFIKKLRNPIDSRALFNATATMHVDYKWIVLLKFEGRAWLCALHEDYPTARRYIKNRFNITEAGAKNHIKLLKDWYIRYPMVALMATDALTYK